MYLIRRSNFSDFYMKLWGILIAAQNSGSQAHELIVSETYACYQYTFKNRQLSPGSYRGVASNFPKPWMRTKQQKKLATLLNRIKDNSTSSWQSEPLLNSQSLKISWHPSISGWNIPDAVQEIPRDSSFNVDARLGKWEMQPCPAHTLPNLYYFSNDISLHILVTRIIT